MLQLGGLVTQIQSGLLGVFGMKKMAAGVFKTNCLALMDEVQAKHETVVITKHGKPVAKLTRFQTKKRAKFGFMKGKIQIAADFHKPDPKIDKLFYDSPLISGEDE